VSGESSKSIYHAPPVRKIGLHDPRGGVCRVGLAGVCGLYQDQIEGCAELDGELTVLPDGSSARHPATIVLDGPGARRPKRRHKFAFSGLVRCGHCDYSMTEETHKGRYVTAEFQHGNQATIGPTPAGGERQSRRPRRFPEIGLSGDVRRLRP
jgi:hypothetical protein